MKVPLQEKIAELEARIVALEKAMKSHSTITRTFTSFHSDGNMWHHWEAMWKEFDLMMKSAFGRESK